jgi:GNAT superfamily N-acetyltransferase
MGVAIRSVRPGEAGLVLSFVKALAAYENLSHAVAATEEILDRALFGPSPRIFCDIAEVDGEPVGFALWFFSYSTFQGAAGIYIEDLFVLPEARGHGAGKALVAHLARRCRDEGLGRLHWAVLDWNAPSIAFYRSLGAEMRDEWRAMGLTGEALAKLGGAA